MTVDVVCHKGRCFYAEKTMEDKLGEVFTDEIERKMLLDEFSSSP